MEELMSVLDELKDSIPEGAYLKLCNGMKTVYDEQNDSQEINSVSDDIEANLTTSQIFVKLNMHVKDALDLGDSDVTAMITEGGMCLVRVKDEHLGAVFVGVSYYELTEDENIEDLIRVRYRVARFAGTWERMVLIFRPKKAL